MHLAHSEIASRKRNGGDGAAKKQHVMFIDDRKSPDTVFKVEAMIS